MDDNTQINHTVNYWIDLTDVGKEGHWIMLSTGKRSTFTSWDSGQPDNSGNQDCAYNNFRKRLGRWDDLSCTSKTQVMCEESGLCIFSFDKVLLFIFSQMKKSELFVMNIAGFEKYTEKRVHSLHLNGYYLCYTKT